MSMSKLTPLSLSSGTIGIALICLVYGGEGRALEPLEVINVAW